MVSASWVAGGGWEDWPLPGGLASCRDAPGHRGDPAPSLSLQTCGRGSLCSHRLGRRPSCCGCRGKCSCASRRVCICVCCPSRPPPSPSPRCRRAVFRPTCSPTAGLLPAFMGVTFLCILPALTKAAVASLKDWRVWLAHCAVSMSTRADPGQLLPDHTDCRDIRMQCWWQQYRI